MVRVNLLAIPLAVGPLLAVPGLFLLLWGWPRMAQTAPVLFRWEILLPSLLGGIVAHELLHAATWMLTGTVPRRSIRFGIQWKTVTPYAHCSVPMPARAYRVGAAVPGVLLGLLPAAIGLVAGDAAWMLYGTFFTIAAAGDAIVLWVLRGIPGTALVEDHPTRAGCYVYDPPVGF
jgi:hypothetical protein